MVASWVENSRHRRLWALNTLEALVLNRLAKPKIAVLGLTYKENTHSLKNSPAIALLEQLRGHAITAYDPVAAEDAVDFIDRAESATAAMQGADVVLVMTPWPEFSSISIAELSSSMAGRVVIDQYRMLDGKELVQGGFTYATLGEGIC